MRNKQKAVRGERVAGQQADRLFQSCFAYFFLLATAPPLISLWRKWRRRESNPRPETTQMAASTRLASSFVLGPPGDHEAASGRNIPSLSHLSTNSRIERPARVFRPMCCGHHTVPRSPVIRRPYEPGRQSQPGLQHRCWQLLFAHFFYQAK